MKKLEVIFRPQAAADLNALYGYLAGQAGLAVAGRYIDRVEAACVSLATFPERGRRRDDIRPGLRILGFERRAAIAFEIRDREVLIIRVLYGGRDYIRGLRGLPRDG